MRLSCLGSMFVALAGCVDEQPAYGPSSLAMFSAGGELVESPLSFDGEKTLLTETDFSASNGACRLTSDSYLDSAFGTLRFEKGIDGKALFALSTGRIDGNATPNPVVAMGYNATTRGGKWRDGENSLAWFIEADWNDGTNRTMETYMQYESADGEGEIRPIFFMFDRQSDRLINAVVRGNPLNIVDDQNRPAMEIGPVVTNLYSTYTHLRAREANLIGDQNVYLKGGNADGTGSVFISAGNEEGSVYLESGTTNPVEICVNGCETRVGGKAVINESVQIGGPTGPRWLSGVGSPEGLVSCGVGCMYTRTDGGPGTTLYVKESGTGATGWVSK